jgi:hypothetical protein
MGESSGIAAQVAGEERGTGCCADRESSRSYTSMPCNACTVDSVREDRCVTIARAESMQNARMGQTCKGERVQKEMVKEIAP